MYSTARSFGGSVWTVGLILAVALNSTVLAGENEPCLTHAECDPESGGFCLQNLCRGASHHAVQRLFGMAIAPVYDLTENGAGTHLGESAETILRGLLGSTVFIETIDPAKTPKTAMLEGWMGSTILFQTWSAVGAYALVKGVIRDVPSGGHALTLRVYLVESGEEVSTLRFEREISGATLRDEMLQWADQIVGEFSGRPGILGTRIAYARQDERGGAKEIYVTGLDGFDEWPVTQNGNLNLLPSWGPNGTDIAYTSYQDNNPDLFLGNQKFSGRESLNMGAEWSPDGREVAISLSKDGDNEIYILDGTTGEILKRLTHDPGIDSSPTWSPDGQSLVFVSDRTGSPQLFMIGRDGSGLRHLPTGQSYATSPDWSPNGSWIAFNAMGAGGIFDLYLLDVTSGRVKRLTRGPGSNEDPSWSPDGRYMVFSSTRGSSRNQRMRQLYVISASGGNATRITRRSGLYSTPAWSPW